MTQTELGIALGVTQGSISFYELDKVAIPPNAANTLIRVARARGLALTYDHIYAGAKLPADEKAQKRRRKSWPSGQ